MKKYLTILVLLLLICGCSTTKKTEEIQTDQTEEIEEVEETNVLLEKIDMSKWLYDKSSDTYYQTGISYCVNPADSEYETLGIFIPGAYFTATENSDGTYTCEINENAQVSGYSVYNAPIVFPVNTPGHKAQDAPDGFSKNASTYTSEGFIYVLAGCRGKDEGVPSGVVDLKAAIRYIRYNESVIPGDMDRVVVFGHSGGGSQCSVLGASGDSELYEPYLNAIGAANTSDVVNAVMAWCPITSFDTADLSYEWNMSASRSGLSDEMKQISDSLASAYATYINENNFVDEDGNVLYLKESNEGIYQSGTYYEYVLDIIEDSLENYFEDENMSEKEIASYINDLNSDIEWIGYEDDEVTVYSLEEFSKHIKKATKPIGAFDKLDEGGHELFNDGDGEMTHFDEVLYEIVKGSEYEDEMKEDLEKLDSLGYSISTRVKMFSPLYYLLETSEGYNTSTVSTYWRIRTGIEQSDTSLCTEINLALALNMYGSDVDFETVWEQGHTQAERTGKGTTNFIDWVEEIFPA